MATKGYVRSGSLDGLWAFDCPTLRRTSAAAITIRDHAGPFAGAAIAHDLVAHTYRRE